jgi:predicted nucleic acid-binding protein
VTLPDSPAVVVDTGVFGAGLAARSAPLAERYRAHLTRRRLLITVQTIAELRFGALKSSWGPARMAQLEQRIARAVIAPCDDHLARVCAQLRLACLRAGHPLADRLHSNDLWVAATAVRYQIPLVAHDGVFRGVPGLALITALGGTTDSGR